MSDLIGRCVDSVLSSRERLQATDFRLSEAIQSHLEGQPGTQEKCRSVLFELYDAFDRYVLDVLTLLNAKTPQSRRRRARRQEAADRAEPPS